MSFSVNNAMIVGNVTRNPELKFTQGGMQILNFGVATNISIKDESEQSGYRDKATFHNVTVFGKMAEWLSKNITKGQSITVTGRIENSEYEKEGVKHRNSKIIADNVIPHKTRQSRDNQQSQGGYQDQDIPEEML